MSQLQSGRLKFGFTVFSLGNIPRNAQESGDLSRVISKRADRQQHRKSRPVLAHIRPLTGFWLPRTGLRHKDLKTRRDDGIHFTREIRRARGHFQGVMKYGRSELADHLLLRVAKHLLRGRIKVGDHAIRSRGNHRGGRTIENGLLKDGLLGELSRRTTKFQLRHHLPSQPGKDLPLFGRQPARHAVNETQGPNILPVGGSQRRTGIKTDTRIAGDQRTGPEPRIL